MVPSGLIRESFCISPRAKHATWYRFEGRGTGRRRVCEEDDAHDVLYRMRVFGMYWSWECMRRMYVAAGVYEIGANCECWADLEE